MISQRQYHRRYISRYSKITAATAVAIYVYVRPALDNHDSENAIQRCEYSTYLGIGAVCSKGDQTVSGYKQNLFFYFFY